MFKSLMQSQKAFFASGQTQSYEWRKQALLRLKSAILSYEQEILEALYQDLGKHRVEGYMSEIMQVLQEINDCLKLLKHYTKPKKVKTPMTHFMGKSFIHYQPYGVILVISPWNYPFSLSLSPLVGAISAGNCVILKPSEYASHTQEILQKIISYAFEENFVSLIKGGSEVILPIFETRPDYVFFTGSVPVGKTIASYCAKSLIPLTLELGGKNPCIVDESADLNLSAKRIVWGKFLNAGQTCVAPDFLLVHHSIKDELLSLLLQEIKNSFGENPISQIGKIISLRHFQRAVSLIGEGKIYGGKSDSATLKIEPTLIDLGSLQEDNPSLLLPLMQEEIFAPILPILSFETLDQCIHLINRYEKPLALYLFSQNPNQQQKILDSLCFGGGCINDCIMHITSPYLPFGGVGESGIGSYHGKYSIETFCHKKSIYHAPKTEIPLRYPPYDKPIFGFSKLKIIKTLFAR